MKADSTRPEAAYLAGLTTLSVLRFRLQVILFLLDLFALSAGILMSADYWSGQAFSGSTVAVVGAFIPFYILTALNGRAFSTDVLVRRGKSAWIGARSVLLSCAGVILAAFFLKSGTQISRMTLFIGGISGSFFVALFRIAIQTWTLHRFGPLLRSEMLIIDNCSIDAPAGMRAVDAKTLGLDCDLADPIMLDRIGRLFAPMDRVVIACNSDRRKYWALLLKGANVHAEIISPELTELGPLGTGRLGNSATVVVAGSSLDLRQRCIKRAFDVSLAIVLLVAFIPIFIAFGIAIRMESPGPVFFVQERIGRGNRLFGIYKFRSMYSKASDFDGNRSASRDDERVTKIGRFIRSTSIDELPQLINILKGEMSFVGPRPHALGSMAGDLLFWEVDERYWHRHVCKPGLTGLAQIRGFRGATHREADLTNRLQADLEYATGWTLTRDFSIFLATLKVIVHRNAY